MLGGRVVQEEDGSCVVGITYHPGGMGRRPPPYRFFRVTLDDLAAAPMAAGYWPPGWGAYF